MVTDMMDSSGQMVGDSDRALSHDTPTPDDVDVSSIVNGSAPTSDYAWDAWLKSRNSTVGQIMDMRLSTMNTIAMLSLKLTGRECRAFACELSTESAFRMLTGDLLEEALRRISVASRYSEGKANWDELITTNAPFAGVRMENHEASAMSSSLSANHVSPRTALWAVARDVSWADQDRFLYGSNNLIKSQDVLEKSRRSILRRLIDKLDRL